jgi:hypothetical protein
MHVHICFHDFSSLHNCTALTLYWVPLNARWLREMPALILSGRGEDRVSGEINPLGFCLTQVLVVSSPPSLLTLLPLGIHLMKPPLLISHLSHMSILGSLCSITSSLFGSFYFQFFSFWKWFWVGLLCSVHWYWRRILAAVSTRHDHGCLSYFYKFRGHSPALWDLPLPKL